MFTLYYLDFVTFILNSSEITLVIARNILVLCRHPFPARCCPKHQLKIQVFSAQVVPIHRAFALFVRFASFISTKARIECIIGVNPGHRCIGSKILLKGERHDFNLAEKLFYQ